MGVSPVPRFTVEEYLALDRRSEHKSEFHDGELFPMNSASWEHAQVACSLGASLRTRLRGGPCRVGTQPVRVRATRNDYVCPDIVVVCGAPVFTDEHVDTLINPKILVEVLSPSTADYDRGGKSVLYRRIESLEEYVVVAQDSHLAEVTRRTGPRQWTTTVYEGAEAVLELGSIGVSVPLAEIFDGIL